MFSRFSRHPWRNGIIAIAVMLVMVLAATLAVATGKFSTQQAHAASPLPCDVYAANGTPCVAAHSTVRALFSTYNGSLYQVQRASDHTFLDIGVLSAGGYANAAAQTSFCAGTSCTITKLYDQTSFHNDLPISWGGFWHGPGPNGADVGADAAALPATVNGHQVFGIKVTPGVGYRIDNAQGVPTGSQPEGIYMVTSSNDVNNQCCFDYGSGETSHTDTGNGTMNAIYWGTACWFGTFGNNPCVGTGPWVEADLENGMYHTTTGSNKDPNNQGVHDAFVSAFEKNNGTSNFTLKYGNAQSGGLTTPFSGALPNGYSPMKLQNSILLGTGGDNSDGDVGEFFEGAVTSGFPTDAAENAVQSSITAAGYGSGGTTTTGVLRGVQSNRCLDVPNRATTNGTFLQIWDCNGQSNQQWTALSNGELQVYGNKCLDVPNHNKSAGTRVEIWDCNGGGNQQWTLNSNGTVVGVESGLCLDVTGAGTANGTQVEIWTCNGGSNQKWSRS
jgi:non-reducing end alpha-L-arabinofuranosidase